MLLEFCLEKELCVCQIHSLEERVDEEDDDRLR